MKMILTCIIAGSMLVSCLFFSDNEALASNDLNPKGARASAMGGASVCLADLWANFYNPANLHSIDKFSAGIFHEIKYGLPQLSTSAFSLCIPAGNGRIGFCAGYFGYSRHRESRAGLAYSMKLFHGINAGLQIDYLGMYSSDNSSRYTAFTFDAGISAEISRELALGVNVFNPVNIHYNGRNGENLSPVMNAGLAYRPVESILLCAELESMPEFRPTCRFGAEFRMGRIFFIRTGVSSLPWENSFGTGFKFKNLLLDITLVRNPVLGYSTSCSISCVF